MGKPKPRPESVSPAEPGASSRDLEELRAILLDQDRERLAELARRVGDRESRASDVGDVFVEALERRDRSDQGVTEALAPRIEGALRQTIERNPRVLADILFPIIGPMIRKAISESFRRMLESFNEGLEHSFTLRGLRWRWESWRSGRPFSEVVLLHTVEYRVEQVFLIHSESGLLIDHAAIETVIAENPDLVSGMFTALRDFAKDSFRVDESGSVGELQVGDLTIWAESAPYTTLAAVVRGTPPSELRDLLQDTSERIHRRFSAEMAAFDGDQAVGNRVHPYLQDCLLQKKSPAQTPVLAWGFVGAVVLILVATIGYFAVSQYVDGRKFDHYLQDLKREPGIVVTQAGREEGKFQVTGLRDPLAVKPETVARSAGFTADELQTSWSSYVSTEDPIVAARVRTVLGVPDDVRIEVSQGQLHLSGSADPDWLSRVRELIHFVPGVETVDLTGLTTLGSPWFRELKDTVEQTRIFFEPGSREIPPREAPKLLPLAQELTRLLAGAIPRSAVRIEVLGMADSAGETEFNQALSEDRAENVRLELIALGLNGGSLIAVGQGEGGSVFSARRVGFRVLVSAAKPGGE